MITNAEQCRKALPPQAEFGPDKCEKWLKDRGCFIGMWVQEGVPVESFPLYVNTQANAPFWGQTFGVKGKDATHANWHLAVEWAARKLGLPLPWRGEDEPPCQCAECEAAECRHLGLRRLYFSCGDRWACRECSAQFALSPLAHKM